MEKIIPLALLPSPIPGHDPTIDLQPLPFGFNRQPASGAEFGYFFLSLFFRKGIDYFINLPAAECNALGRGQLRLCAMAENHFQR
ncbi:MAG: hypothetical protein ABSE00_03255 [Chitinispirillaceae bacterium]|jgi:hypothetical protein